MTARLLNIQQGSNFRELGGYQTQNGQQVKYHKILRSGNLANLTDADLNYLTDYGVVKSIDFRSPQEVKTAPDRLTPQMTYAFDPVFRVDETESTRDDEASYYQKLSQTPGIGHRQMLSAYHNLITDTHPQKAYHQFFELLLTNTQDNQAVLFHCTAGKDRTGIGAYLFLRALGVDQQTAEEDYLFTNNVIKDEVNQMIADLPSDNQNLVDSIRSFQSVKMAYLAQAQTEIRDIAGNINHYLETVLDLSSHDLRDLKKIYLQN
ncbi:tyrosine-protein phosphatase [Lapidilactobacillus bayanensis]|uniref:tyrosine-protein phosphatase n=1 Tax=Lapidilactobacillus bayanensis TaxID=2485998 RepID=UPI000F7AA540|nr:tyrosine-protein phosphatase [Lapidilactobacillus bayanensis]